ncbi:unnamed protein product [Notodromas monacha]|uniref:THAP-type domain-containing protein n=1 Tax=Notodromas monacha TaxID=399045 RepID=A0A7R9GH97_9CRUS|nr:unnamed protein product [Notodromas monacha]CAG0920684.1 unnamed protein product [Notodromas monacha]
MPSCAVAGCRNRSSNTASSGVSEHRFPRDPAVRQVWADFCKRSEDFEPSRTAILCSAHFVQDCFERDLCAELTGYKRVRKLKPGAVPTIQPAGMSEGAGGDSDAGVVVVKSAMAPLKNGSPAHGVENTTGGDDSVRKLKAEEQKRRPAATGAAVMAAGKGNHPSVNGQNHTEEMEVDVEDKSRGSATPVSCNGDVDDGDAASSRGTSPPATRIEVRFIITAVLYLSENIRWTIVEPGL